MKKYLHKGIVVSILILGLVCLLSTQNFNKQTIKTDVSKKYANTNRNNNRVTQRCKTDNITDTAGGVLDFYGFQDEVEDSRIVISVNPQNPGDSDKLQQVREQKFVLSKINNRHPYNFDWSDPDKEHLKKKVYYNHALSINMSELRRYRIADDKDVDLTFFADDAVIKNPDTNVGGYCLADVTVKVTITNVFVDAGIYSHAGSNDELVNLSNIAFDTGEINCAHPKDAFERDFCSFQSSASSGTHTINKGDLSGSVSNASLKHTGTIGLTCDKSYYNNLNTTSTSYYTNKVTWKATKVENVPLNESYIYRFAPGNYYYDSEPLKCSRRCTETVVVEYGPPVATKAGFCFEYQVQATSYVNCKVETVPGPPVQLKGYCSPMPRCVHKHYTITRAGPNDNFDDCVSACDGGKYSEACSEKCYNKIYNKGTNKLLRFSDASEYSRKIAATTVDGQVDECLAVAKNYQFKLNKYKDSDGDKTFYGCYYWTNTSHTEIKWIGDEGGGKTDDTPTRYYHDEDPNRNYSKYVIVGGGFVRKKHGSNDYCHANCYYSTTNCNQRFSGTRAQIFAGNQYLNKGMAHDDNVINAATYERALNTCKAKAICKKTKATFTISVDGTAVATPEDYIDTNANTKKITDFVKENVSGSPRRYDGCYVNRDSNNIWYKTVWGFPGACISQKYGTLKNNGDPSCGDDYHPREYCLPYSVNKVNQTWWRYYYTKLFGHSTGVDTSLQSAEFKAKYGNSWEVHSLSGFTPTWNIIASTRGFGYYSWNIDISCFYAYDSLGPPSDDGPDEKYIRAVDLNNLFPDTGGSILNDPSNVGRQNAPLNWSKYSTNTKKDTTGLFDSEPDRYLRWVQKQGYAIYNNANLDYRVVLTPENINTIKGMSNGYGTFPGEMKSDRTTSVANYKSSLLRTTLAGHVSLPSETALQCNNIKNHNTCEDYS